MKHLFQFLKEYWSIILALFGAFWFVSYLALVGAWTLYGEKVIERAKEELGINELIESTGGDRILRQPAGQTFVYEPVYYCDPRISDCGNINMVFTFARTTRGKSCVYKNVTPIFVTEDGATLVGEFLGRGSQYGTDIVRRELTIARPDQAIPVGRTTLALQLEYECDGIQEFEMTDPAIFYVTEKVEGN